MDVRNSSNEPCGYLKEVKNNDMVQTPRGIQPRSSWHGRTLSRKDRGVKIFEGRLGVKLVIDPFDGAKPRPLGRGRKRRSGSTLSKPQPLVLSAVEGSGWGVEGLTF